MSYLSVITLERAKNYLRVDLDFDTDDSEITSMINAACRYVEKRTNHILYARDITYKGSCQVKVYDYPINSIVTVPTPFKVDFAMFTVCPDVKEVELNVGYGTDEVPDIFIQSALQIIKIWYYEAEKQINSQMIPISVTEALDVEKRFL